MPVDPTARALYDEQRNDDAWRRHRATCGYLLANGWLDMTDEAGIVWTHPRCVGADGALIDMHVGVAIEVQGMWDALDTPAPCLAPEADHA